MNFFRLKAPEYDSDMQYSRKNPVKWVSMFNMPGMICPLCGTWSGFRRRYVSINNQEVKVRLKKSPAPIDLDKWRILADWVKTDMGMGENFEIKPGDIFGEPTGMITNDQTTDFVFPWQGGILVPEKTLEILERAKLTGFQVMEVNLIDKRRRNIRIRPLPVLYVLVIVGRIKPPAVIQRCDVCSRFVDRYEVEPNDENWDGSDFCIDENYPLIAIVSERVCAVLKENKLKNYQCELIKTE